MTAAFARASDPGRGTVASPRRRGRWRVLDHELVLVPFNRRGKTSGLELGHMRSKGANLFHVRDGKVNRLVFYWDRDRALADLGLTPKTTTPDP